MVAINKLFAASLLSLAVAAPAEDAAHNGLAARAVVDTSALVSAVGGLLDDVVSDVEGLLAEILNGKLLTTPLGTTVADTLDEVQEIVDKLADIVGSIDLSQLGTPGALAVADLNVLKGVAARASKKVAADPSDPLDPIISRIGTLVDSLVGELGKIVGALPGDLLGVVGLLGNLLGTVVGLL